MNTNEFKLVAAVALGTATVGIAAISHIKTTREERAKRRDIQKNLDLDLKAIRLAGEQIAMRLKRGDFDNALVLGCMNAYNEELEFQKIAVRIQD